MDVKFSLVEEQKVVDSYLIKPKDVKQYHLYSINQTVFTQL